MNLGGPNRNPTFYTKEVIAMKDKKIPVPRVLLQAKEQASRKCSDGPWDQGHWANRK